MSPGFVEGHGIENQIPWCAPKFMEVRGSANFGRPLPPAPSTGTALAKTGPPDTYFDGSGRGKCDRPSLATIETFPKRICGDFDLVPVVIYGTGGHFNSASSRPGKPIRTRSESYRFGRPPPPG